MIILQGRADELRLFAERVFATRGVKHGGIEMIAAGAAGKASREQLHVHLHAHPHEAEHEHEHEHGHRHAHPKRS